ncbi:hypothetical protein CALVIDRAFT_220717 [Calocera viscosa TUFC12733]|uniref:Uncharacterized protein n=1 Tax=Calocera viscosa (strain TUFC12733) TaxID=1330018 RepID=A0A167RKD1_CALVF|nr:hypothetical protein CALVIDRAFT_220717 [Calocera viscosa TUFC12733]
MGGTSCLPELCRSVTLRAVPRASRVPVWRCNVESELWPSAQVNSINTPRQGRELDSLPFNHIHPTRLSFVNSPTPASAQSHAEPCSHPTTQFLSRARSSLPSRARSSVRGLSSPSRTASSTTPSCTRLPPSTSSCRRMALTPDSSNFDNGVLSYPINLSLYGNADFTVGGYKLITIQHNTQKIVFRDGHLQTRQVTGDQSLKLILNLGPGPVIPSGTIGLEPGPVIIDQDGTSN